MKKLPLLALGLMLVLAVFSLAACGEDDQDGQISQAQSDKDIFSAGLSDSILDFSDLTSSLASMQLDILLNPDTKFAADKSNNTQFDITLTGGDDSITLHQNLLYDAKSGDAARTVDIKLGEESSGSSGVYFIGNQMLVSPRDSEKPMIRYTIADTSGMKTASVYERLDMVFSERYQKLTNEQWQSAVDGYCQSISFVAEDAYTQQETAVTLAETSQTVNAYTLNLAGQDAYTVFAGFIALLDQDAAFAGYAQNAQQKLAAMDQAAKDGMTLVFTVNLLGSKAIGFAIDAACNDGSKFALSTVNYQDGYARQIELHLATFDGVTIASTAVFGALAEQKQNCSINYQMNDPRSYTYNESISLSGSGLIDSGKNVSYTLNFTDNLSYTDEGENSSYQVTGPLQYTSTTTDTGADSTITINGLILTSDGDASDPINMTINIKQAYEDVTITAPQFIAGSGVEAATTADLVSALDADFTAVEYKSMPQSLRMVFSAVAL